MVLFSTDQANIHYIPIDWYMVLFSIDHASIHFSPLDWYTVQFSIEQTSICNGPTDLYMAWLRGTYFLTAEKKKILTKTNTFIYDV